MALGTGLSFQYWDTTANKTKRIAVDDSVTSNVGRFYQAQVRQLYTGSAGALNIKSLDTDDDLAVFNEDGTVSIGVSGQNTTIAGNLVVTGDVTVNGTTTTVESTVVTIADNVIFVNSGPSGSKNSGYASERYQTANQAGTGDVVGDSAALVVTLADIGDQTGMSDTQVTLTGGSSTNDYYNGMWIKTAINNNVRRITDYNGTTKVATIATAWTDQPASNSALSIYTPFQGLMFNETDNRFVFARTAGPDASEAILDHMDLSVGTLRADDGIYSSNGIILNSGTAANNVVKSSGGDLMVSGGMGNGGVTIRTNNGGAANGLDIASTSITSYQSIVASSDSSKDLGSSTVAWRDLFVDRVTSLTANGYVQIGSATVALRLPNQDDTEQGALAAVAAGCLVWNTTDTQIQVYNGSAWVAVGSSDTSGLTGTTNASYTINSDGAPNDTNASLILISDNDSDNDTGTLTYIAAVGGGTDTGTWSFAADVRIADAKHLYIGNDNDIAASWDGDDLVLNVAGGLNADFSAAVAFDSTAGISIDAGGASNFTVTGGADLTLSTVSGGSVVINASTDVTIDANGSFSIDGTDTSNLSVTGADLTVSTITSGTLAVTSAGALNLSSTTGDWQASGALTIDSSGGAISIGGDADAQAINIGTGAAARTITFGNTSGATALVFNAGTGLLDFNASVKMAFGSDFAFDGFTIDGGLASGEFAYISGNNTLSEATAASGGHADLIEGVYNGTGLVVSGPVNIKKPSGEVWAAGDRVFVNNAASGGTTTAPSASGTDVREIGRVMNAAGNGTTTARILLDLTKDTVGNP
jgi:hypothetical protein